MPKTEELVPGSPEERRKARDKGLYYLQFSDKTESEMRKKLAEQGFSPASVEDAVNFLLEYRYLNDENYALRYLEKNGKKKSRRQIAFELMEEIPVDEEAQILALLEKKKYSGEAASREERQKISGFLARKGFSYEAISAALIHYARKETE